MLKCICTSILVAFDLEKGESMKIPEDWTAAIAAYERWV